MTELKLKPCPFCGGNGRLSYRQMRFIGQNYMGDKKIRMGVQVICNRCKARGPLFTGVVINPSVRVEQEMDATFIWMIENAKKAWNRMVKGDETD